jgi:hypothetical protein
MSRCIENVVGNKKGMPMEKSSSMKIMQDEKPAEKEPRIPERIRNPTIQIIVGQRRRIVGDYRRTIIIVIVVDNLRARIRDVIICLRFRIFIGWLTGGRRLDCFPNHLDLIPVFLGDGFIPVGEMGTAAFIDIFINDGAGRPATWGGLGGRCCNRTQRDAQTKLGLKIPYRLHGLFLFHA